MSGEILCAGAGRGGLSKVLSRAGYQVVSIDLHPEHFAAPAMSCQYADLLQPLQFADEIFDVVLAVEVVEHLENPWRFLREAIRVLRPGGVLVFTSPNVQSVASRIDFLATGELSYFKRESFFGCYHVTPIFRWAVERWCSTTMAQLVSVTYNRANWPTATDVPRYDGRLGRWFKTALPVNELTGEIACFSVAKVGAKKVEVGVHSS